MIFTHSAFLLLLLSLLLICSIVSNCSREERKRERHPNWLSSASIARIYVFIQDSRFKYTLIQQAQLIHHQQLPAMCRASMLLGCPWDIIPSNETTWVCLAIDRSSLKHHIKYSWIFLSWELRSTMASDSGFFAASHSPDFIQCDIDQRTATVSWGIDCTGSLCTDYTVLSLYK